MVARANGRAKAATRLLLTRRTRTLAGAQINRWLADYVATVNSMTFPHLFVIDETALVQKFGGVALGQFLNTSAFQHCAVLSQRLAPAYRARLSAVGRLVDKKLVICDLDNTLWDGVIGEGAVVHFMDRQRTLKRLKDHSGVVLSIASKNDPANVRFDGGALNLSDFVAPQISWGQKCAAIAKIKSTLNLQTRHMVFLDDRADERALVKEMFTDLLTLDPCDSETWSQIECWGEISLGSSDLDRTRMYQEQALRDAEIESADAAFARADDETIKKLGLVITIGEAARSDLKRVAELINRTNQWNLCGSRTSFEEVRSWHASEQALVLVARVADRFGDMGTVCVAVVLLHEDDAEIPVFVLSCRVFGYGIESAMLAEIGRRCAIGTRRQALRGRYSSNAQNHPCRNMYADHGFSQLDGVFEWTGAPALPAVPGAEVRLAT
jgi:FkbH-like protein